MGIGKIALYDPGCADARAVRGPGIAVAVHWIFWKATPRSVDTFFRRGQLVSASLYSLGHGGNDAQKTMGIIFALLVATAVAQPDSVAKPSAETPADAAPIIFNEPPDHKKFPTEVVLACHLAMGLGTLFGGWRIVKTMGQASSVCGPSMVSVPRPAPRPPSCYGGPRHSGQHHAHDHGGHRRRRFPEATQCRGAGGSPGRSCGRGSSRFRAPRLFQH